MLPQRPEHSAGGDGFPSGANQHSLVPPVGLIASEYRLKIKLPFPLVQQHHARSGRDVVTLKGLTVERPLFRSYSCGFKYSSLQLYCANRPLIMISVVMTMDSAVYCSQEELPCHIIRPDKGLNEIKLMWTWPRQVSLTGSHSACLSFLPRLSISSRKN